MPARACPERQSKEAGISLSKARQSASFFAFTRRRSRIRVRDDNAKKKMRDSMLKKRERALEEPFPKKEKILSGFQNLEPIRRGAMIKSFQDLPFQPFSTL
jgi:hypothetical protein